MPKQQIWKYLFTASLCPCASLLSISLKEPEMSVRGNCGRPERSIILIKTTSLHGRRAKQSITWLSCRHRSGGSLLHSCMDDRLARKQIFKSTPEFCCKEQKETVENVSGKNLQTDAGILNTESYMTFKILRAVLQGLVNPHLVTLCTPTVCIFRCCVSKTHPNI